MKILIDTNLLARSLQPKHPQHALATAALETVRTLGYTPCVVPQVIYELWVVATRPAEQNGLGLQVSRVAREVDSILRLHRLYRDERQVFDRWIDLVTGAEISGKLSHDARLVAAMQRHGMTHLLTFNQSDFTRFSDISVVTPDNVASLQPVE